MVEKCDTIQVGEDNISSLTLNDSRITGANSTSEITTEVEITNNVNSGSGQALDAEYEIEITDDSGNSHFTGTVTARVNAGETVVDTTTYPLKTDLISGQTQIEFCAFGLVEVVP